MLKFMPSAGAMPRWNCAGATGGTTIINTTARTTRASCFMEILRGISGMANEYRKRKPLFQLLQGTKTGKVTQVNYLRSDLAMTILWISEVPS